MQRLQTSTIEISSFIHQKVLWVFKIENLDIENKEKAQNLPSLDHTNIVKHISTLFVMYLMFLKSASVNITKENDIRSLQNE